MKIIVALVLLIALAGAGAWYARNEPDGSARARTAASQPATQTASASAIGVDEFMRNVDRHRGTVSVVGVVSSASAERQVVALIDSKEFAECGTTNCASLTLPVRWAGPMPVVQKTVRVEGEVRETGGKLLFIANALQELPQ